jgi:hypothetical protein
MPDDATKPGFARGAADNYLLDCLDLDAVAERCEEMDRASFLCVVATLRLREGTGFPGQPDRDLLKGPITRYGRCSPLAALRTMAAKQGATSWRPKGAG